MLSVAIASAILQSQKYTVITHPRLQAEQSFDVQITQLPALLDTLSKSTGIEIRAVKPLYNLKLDIYTGKIKVGTVLAKIAETLNAEWEQTSTGFVLTQQPKTQNDERNYLQAEIDYARQNADFEIAVCKRIAQIVPPTTDQRMDPKMLAAWKEAKITGIGSGGDKNFFEEYKAASQNAKGELDQAIAQKKSPEELRPLRIEAEALSRIAAGSPPLIKSRLLSNLTAKELETYRSGLPFACSTEGSGKSKIYAGDIVGGFIAFKNGEPSPCKAFGLTQIIPETFELAYVEYAYGDGATGISGGAGRTSPVNGIPELLETHPFIQTLRGWEQNAQLQPSFPQLIDSTKAQSTPSPYFVKGFRFGDHLRWLHQATGLPVVAIANRKMHKWAKLERQFRTAGDYLTAFQKAGGGFFRKSGDFVLGRTGSYWRDRQTELPESWYAPLEAQPKLNYRAYCRAALPLTRIQSMLLSSREGFLTKFDPTPFQGSILALKLIGGLSDTQVNQALKPEGLSITDMSSAQVQQVQTTILQSVLEGTYVKPDFLVEIIDKGFDPRTYAGVSFAIKPGSKTNMLVGSTVVDDGQTVVQPQKDYKDIFMTDFVFTRHGQEIMRFHGYGG